MTDNINKPNHYIGTYGLEVKDVTRNFIKGKSERKHIDGAVRSSIYFATKRKTVLKT